MEKILLFILCLCAVSAYSQTSDITIATISNYNQWGWDAVVMKNGIITLATIPAIGGRVMQYDLGNHPSVYVNPSELGNTYTPFPNGNWPDFGGFKNWPSPQGSWSNGGWPPPPNLDYGTYTIQDTIQTADSVAFSISSPVEQWYTPGIRFNRTATIYPGTSRVKMEQTIINTGNSSVSWGVWGITQSIAKHTGKTDFQNFWAYFPINPNSVFGETGASPQGGSQSWMGEVAPGVYGVQYNPENNKIFADPDKGWIAYAVLSDTIVFIKTFQVFEGMTYPDGGARVSVYVNNSTEAYMEIETKAPVVHLTANGGSYTFTENWWTAKVLAPVLDANNVGAIAARLSYNSDSKILSARYGIFHEGFAKVVCFDSQSQILLNGQSHPASPIREFQLGETITIPSGASVVKVQVYNSQGKLVGTLDSANVSDLVTAVNVKKNNVPLKCHLSPNYPNPFNGGTVITFFCPTSTQGTLKVFDILGREIAVLESGVLSPGEHKCTWNPGSTSSGVYIVKLAAGGVQQIQKMIYLR